METNELSARHINLLEQQITQLLKTMRLAKLGELAIYKDLQALEQELAEARRQHFDANNTDYPGY